MLARLSLISALVAGLLPAAVLSYEFAGVVDNSAYPLPGVSHLAGVSVGSPVSGTLVFDTTAASPFVQSSSGSTTTWTSRIPGSAFTLTLQLAGSLVPVSLLGTYNTYLEVRHLQASDANVPDTMIIQVQLERDYGSGQSFSAFALLFSAIHGTITPPSAGLNGYTVPLALVRTPSGGLASNDLLLTGIVPTETNLSQHDVTGQSGFAINSLRVAEVPEPGSLQLLSLAVGAMALRVPRRQPFSNRRIL